MTQVSRGNRPGVALPIRIHELLLSLAGRLDDDALADARQMLASAELDRSLEFVAGCLAAGGVVLTGPQHRELEELFANTYLDPSVIDRVVVRDGAPAYRHRFAVGAVDGREPDQGVSEAIRPVLDVLPDVRSVWCVWRLTPSGPVSGPVPHRLVLVGVGPGGFPPATAYRVEYALRRAGIRASVEVLVDGGQPTDYHQEAMRCARQVPFDDPGPGGGGGRPSMSPVEPVRAEPPFAEPARAETGGYTAPTPAKATLADHAPAPAPAKAAPADRASAPAKSDHAPAPAKAEPARASGPSDAEPAPVPVTPVAEPARAQVSPAAEPAPVPVPPVAEPAPVPVPPVAEPARVLVPPAAEPARVPDPQVAEPARFPVPPAAEPGRVPVPPVAEPARVPVPPAAEPGRVPDPQVAESARVEVVPFAEPAPAPPVAEPAQVAKSEPAATPAADSGDGSPAEPEAPAAKEQAPEPKHPSPFAVEPPKIDSVRPVPPTSPPPAERPDPPVRLSRPRPIESIKSVFEQERAPEEPKDERVQPASALSVDNPTNSRPSPRRRADRTRNQDERPARPRLVPATPPPPPPPAPSKDKHSAAFVDDMLNTQERNLLRELQDELARREKQDNQGAPWRSGRHGKPGTPFDQPGQVAVNGVPPHQDRGYGSA